MAELLTLGWCDGRMVFYSVDFYGGVPIRPSYGRRSLPIVLERKTEVRSPAQDHSPRRLGSMPIEVLTREEIEKIVEEKLKRILSEMQISKKIAELESSTAKLRDAIAKPSIKETAVAEPEPIAAALTRDLAQLEELLQIGITSTSVTLKPRAYLGAQQFRAVSEIVRKYGGAWYSQRRMFIVSKRGSRTVSTI